MIVVTKDEKVAGMANIRQVSCIFVNTPMLAKRINIELKEICNIKKL